MKMRQSESDTPGDRRIFSALRQIKAFAEAPDSDCSCPLIIGELLAHLVPRQRAAVVQELFMSALRQRTKVGTLLELLKELEQFGPASEIGEVEEAALIFDDVANRQEWALSFSEPSSPIGATFLVPSNPLSLKRPGKFHHEGREPLGSARRRARVHKLWRLGRWRIARSSRNVPPADTADPHTGADCRRASDRAAWARRQASGRTSISVGAVSSETVASGVSHGRFHQHHYICSRSITVEQEGLSSSRFKE